MGTAGGLGSRLNSNFLHNGEGESSERCDGKLEVDRDSNSGERFNSKKEWSS